MVARAGSLRVVSGERASRRLVRCGGTKRGLRLYARPMVSSSVEETIVERLLALGHTPVVTTHPDAKERRLRAERNKSRREMEAQHRAKKSAELGGEEDTVVRPVRDARGFLEKLRDASLGRDKEGVGEGEEEELRASSSLSTVVFFHGPWCRACRALKPKIQKLAERSDYVQFISVDASEASELCDALNVCKLPFFQIYDGASGLVFEKTASLRRDSFKVLANAIQDSNFARCLIVPPVLPQQAIKLVNRGLHCR